MRKLVIHAVRGLFHLPNVKLSGPSSQEDVRSESIHLMILGLVYRSEVITT